MGRSSSADFSNKPNRQIMAKLFCAAIICLFLLIPGQQSALGQSVGPYDLINLVNGMRSANGLGALSVDSSLMACAQSTAETMAASHMTWHIGNVSGRASSFGYNNYNTCFATENFTMGSAGTTISQIQASWSDATHMIPMQSSSYCHIGAGVATGSDGFVYYVVQAAYPANTNGCGYARTTGNAGSAGSGAVSFITAVETATPDDKGRIFHKVEEGQTLWSISEAYKVSIEDIQSWNDLKNSTALSLGQMLYIPASGEAGITPTPAVELTIYPTADSSGKYFHIVSEGDTFWSISELWNVPINEIYKANNMSENNSIGLGWEIAIPVTATVTPLPTETPTATPEPTATEVPTPSPTVPEEPSDAQDTETSDSLLPLPQASQRTYIILGGFVILCAAACAAVYFLQKKGKNKRD